MAVDPNVLSNDYWIRQLCVLLEQSGFYSLKADYPNSPYGPPKHIFDSTPMITATDKKDRFCIIEVTDQIQFETLEFKHRWQDFAKYAHHHHSQVLLFVPKGLEDKAAKTCKKFGISDQFTRIKGLLEPQVKEPVEAL